jgi:predicted secreted protein
MLFLEGNAWGRSGAHGAITPDSDEGLGGWPQRAFLAGDVDTALGASIGHVEILPDEHIALSAPDFAENGALVRAGVATDIPGAESVILVSAPEPFPLATTRLP